MEKIPRYTLIKNMMLVDPDRQFPRITSLLFMSQGKTSKVLEEGENIRTGALEGGNLAVYNAQSHYACAGFTDLMVNTCEPGFMHRETLNTCSAAAAAGGVTAMVALPDTNPPSRGAEVIEYVKSNSASLPCEIIQSVRLGGEKGGECDPERLRASGAEVVFADGSEPPETLFRTLQICKSAGLSLIVRCCSSSDSGALGCGKIADAFKVSGVPRWKQSVPVYTLVALAAESGCHLHISCISSEESVRLIREAKARGVNITCGTCPQYFTFFENDIFMHGSSLKLMPPLGKESDRRAIIEGLADGTVDCISSDHTPHTKKDKSRPIKDSPFGMTGVQTLFAASYTGLVEKGHIGISRLISLLSANPAEIINRPRKLTPGAPANIVIFSTNREFEFTAALNRSKSENSPFIGSTLRGEIIKSFYNGKPI